jgi:hypothetical protein
MAVAPGWRAVGRELVGPQGRTATLTRRATVRPMWRRQGGRVQTRFCSLSAINTAHVSRQSQPLGSVAARLRANPGHVRRRLLEPVPSPGLSAWPWPCDRSGCDASRLSSRYVPSRSTGARSMRRATYKDIAGPLVGPVEILKHHDRGSLGVEILEQRPPDLVGARSSRDELRRHPIQLSGDLDNGPKRSRNRQRVADTPEHSRTPSALAEAAHERRLPNTRLPCHEHDRPSPRPIDVTQTHGQYLRLAIPLQKRPFHTGRLPPSPT